MKKLLLFLFCAGIFTSFNANADFLFFVPPGKTEDISKGLACVSHTNKVGDILIGLSGNTAKILSISGPFSNCKNPNTPIKADLEFNLKFNAKSGFDLPDNSPGDFRPGFEKQTLTQVDYFQGKLYRGIRSNPEAYITISTINKTRSLDEEMKRIRLVESQNSRKHNSLQITNISINGLNAIRSEFFDYLNSKSYTFIHTLIESADEFIFVQEWCKTEDLTEMKPIFIKVADSIRGFSASSISNKNNSEIIPVIQPIIQKPNITVEPTSVNATTKFENKVQSVNSEQSIGAKKLIELKSLLDKGLITQKDYDSKKTEILKSM